MSELLEGPAQPSSRPASCARIVANSVRPEISEELDPAAGIVTLAQHGAATTPILVLTGWVLASTVLGTLVTRRRSVA